MVIKDIMTVEPMTASPGTTIVAAASMMLDKGLMALPIIDDGRVLLGIVTDGDLLRRPELDTAPDVGWWRGFLQPEKSARVFTKTRGRLVEEIMTSPVTTVTTNTDLADAVVLMQQTRIKQVPVVNGSVLVGLLSRRDILAYLVKRMSAVNDTAVADETIASQIRATIAHSTWTSKGTVTVAVVAGVVTLSGTIFSDAERQALRVIAENTGGVSAVRDDLTLIDPIAGMAYGMG